MDEVINSIKRYVEYMEFEYKSLSHKYGYLSECDNDRISEFNSHCKPMYARKYPVDRDELRYLSGYYYSEYEKVKDFNKKLLQFIQ